MIPTPWRQQIPRAGNTIQQEFCSIFQSCKCEEVGFVIRPHILVGGVHIVTTVLKVVEEEQEGLQEIEVNAQSRRETLTACMDDERRAQLKLEPRCGVQILTTST